MTLSFRTRLFATAGLIVSLVLVTVLIVGYQRVLAYEVGRLDERLCMEAKRLATQTFPGEDLQRLQLDMMAKLRITQPEQLMLKFESVARSTGPAGDVTAYDSTNNSINDAVRDAASFQSPGWPQFLTLDSSAWQPGPLSAQPDSDQSLRPGGLGNDRPPRADRPPPRPDQRVGASPANDPAQDPARGAEPRSEPRPEAGPGLASGREPDRGPPPGGLGCALASFDGPTGQWRAARINADAGNGLLAVDLTAPKGELQAALRQALQWVVPLAAVLTALGAWLLASLTMRPVTRLQQAMASVTQKALSARIPVQGEDREFAALMEVYNTMLARLEKSFQQASRFSSDAAHELKTPLTILQGQIEQALLEATQSALQTKLVSLLDEVARLSDITRKLLLLSQADAGYLAIQKTPIDATRMLDDLAADLHMLVTTQSLECIIDRQLTLSGDAVLLRQLFNNLISNAVRYGLPGGWIKLRACAHAGGIQVDISNNTLPIKASSRARFFDRFFRGDAAHNRQVEGSGLGLSLSREIALAHGGDLRLLPSQSDTVTLRLTL